MISDKSLSVSLEEFGLSQYEARAYVALITKGTISASELAYYAELPRTKVYPVLLRLEKKKLAVISKSKPIMCTAISPEDAFDDILHEQINKVNAMNSLVSDLKKISEESKRTRGSEEKRYFQLTPNNILKQLRVMIEGAESSAYITADQWGFGLLAECKEQIIGALRKGVDVRIIIPSGQVGTESFKTMPDGAKIRIADVSQNCYVFDGVEVLLVDSDNGMGAVFSSASILGSNQTKMFFHIWRKAAETTSLADMTKGEAQEICRIIKVIEENALGYILSSSMSSNEVRRSLVELLESNGISLTNKPLEEVIEILDSTVQITCSGHVKFDTNNKNLAIESKVNSGHSLPWVFILEEYLKKRGFKTRTVYQNQQKGEKVHIKIS